MHAVDLNAASHHCTNPSASWGHHRPGRSWRLPGKQDAVRGAVRSRAMSSKDMRHVLLTSGTIHNGLARTSPGQAFGPRIHTDHLGTIRDLRDCHGAIEPM